MDAATLPWTTVLIVTLALVTALGLLGLRRKSDAEVLFAVFCGSLALAMLRPWVTPDAGALWWVAAVGGSATCNAYWLVSRALFRGDGAVGARHAAVALGVATLILLWRLLHPAADVTPGPLVAVLGALLDLAGAAMLVLAFGEGLRGWNPGLTPDERRLRLGFLIVFGGCVLVGTSSRAITEMLPDGNTLQRTVTSLCALAIVLYTLGALALRRRQRQGHPMAEPDPMLPQATPDASSSPTPEDDRLAAAILRLLEVDAIHLDPELKVADLASRLGTPEHKVSRAITHGLGERNFNRLVNRHRIQHACRLLDTSALSVLDISLASGFASLGPFNRTFKEATGLTPTAYRRRRSSDTTSDDATRPAVAQR
jgi:AraC-like DNA-binding protein